MSDTRAPLQPRFLLPLPLRQAMLDHTAACLPEEACGLFGGRITTDGLVFHAECWLPVENALHSPVRFRMDPTAQLDGFRAIEEAGLELVAFFHSHPHGPNHPSPTDLGEFAYPGVLSLIVSPAAADGWQARAYQIEGVLSPMAAFSEVEIFSPAADGGARPARRDAHGAA
jgi:proteasome lid subunit RPN8/RPN11